MKALKVVFVIFFVILCGQNTLFASGSLDQNQINTLVKKGYIGSIYYQSYDNCVMKKNAYALQYKFFKRSDCFLGPNQKYSYFLCPSSDNCSLFQTEINKQAPTSVSQTGKTLTALSNEQTTINIPQAASPISSGYMNLWLGNDGALSHQVGQPIAGSGWKISTGDATEKYLNYGPYVTVDSGKYYRVDFSFTSGENFTNKSAPILVLDVFDSKDGKILTQKEVWADDFLGGTKQSFYIVFKSTGGVYEFRSLWKGGGEMTLNSISVKEADEGLVGKWFHSSEALTQVGEMPGAPVYVENGVWYFFNRRMLPKEETPSFCPGQGIAVGLRSSNDKGKTWSEEKAIINPTYKQGDPDACQVLDGTMFYNSQKKKRQYFSQCHGVYIPGESPRKMCLYSSSAIDGVYERETQTVITHGDFWNKICKGSDECKVGQVFDEGTPEFIYEKNGYYYFTFHGYDGVKGYRGMVKTKDFINWDATGANLPGEPLFTQKDCKNIDYGVGEPCIGGGAASSIESGDFTYMIVEGPTKNLACTAFQYWPFLMLRSYKYESTGNWELSDDKVKIKPVGPLFCGIQYAKFIKDGDDVYLFYTLNRGDDKGTVKLSTPMIMGDDKIISASTPLYYIGKENKKNPNPNPNPNPIPVPIPHPEPNPIIQGVDGKCGRANNTSRTTKPSDSLLCEVGEKNNFQTTESTYSWDCLGKDGGTTVSCEAKKRVRVTFSTNSGSSISGRRYTYGESFGTYPLESQKTGYVFLGWYLSSNGDALITPSYTVKKDQTFFAIWGKNGSVKGEKLEKYINYLYYNIFQRAPDEAGLAYWKNDIESGTISLDQLKTAIVCAGILESGVDKENALKWKDKNNIVCQ